MDRPRFDDEPGAWFGQFWAGLGGDAARAGAWGWRRRTRTMFERGDMRYVMLSLLGERPMHGYEIIRELERRFEGRYTPSPGSIYPTLQLLEDMGYVSSRQEDGKRVYMITEAGRSHLDESKGRVDNMWERVGPDSREASGSGEFRQLYREFGMLVKTLPMIMHNLDSDKIRRIRELLVRTRREIEDIAHS